MLKSIILLGLLLVVNGCSNVSKPITKEINKKLSFAYKDIKVGESKNIIINNTFPGDLILFTKPYIGKEALNKVISNEELLEQITLETGLREGMHLYIIDGEKIVVHEMLPNYVDIEKGILYSTNKDIVLKVEKLDRSNRPLIIKAIE